MLPKTAKDTKDSQSRLDFFLMHMLAWSYFPSHLIMQHGMKHYQNHIAMIRLKIEMVINWVTFKINTNQPILIFLCFAS